jgi:hypothetical protein
MGTYVKDGLDIKDSLKEWLEKNSDTGEITAQAVAEAWNYIAHDQEWDDRLIAIDDMRILEGEMPKGGEE